MGNHKSGRGVLGLVAVAVGAMASAGVAGADTIVLQDSMSYANEGDMNAAWAGPYGTGGLATVFETPIDGATDPTPASGESMRLGNGVVSRSLDQAVTEDWTVEMKMLVSDHQRGVSFWLLNSAGTRGYGFNWDTSNPDQPGSSQGAGYLSIRKFDNAAHADWGSFGGGIDLVTVSGVHPIAGYAVTVATDNQGTSSFDTGAWLDFMDVKLTWEKDTGTLTLYANGSQVAQTTDQDFDSFDALYLRGNSFGYYDEITVSIVPEPAALGLSTLGAVALLGGRHRPR